MQIVNRGLIPLDKQMLPILDVNILPGVDTNSSLLNFTWECIDVTNHFLEFQVNYSNPKEISKHFNKDKIQVQFHGPQYFQAVTGLVLQDDELQVQKRLPLQISVELGSQIQTAVQVIASSSKAAIVLNILLNLVVGGAL